MKRLLTVFIILLLILSGCSFLEKLPEQPPVEAVQQDASNSSVVSTKEEADISEEPIEPDTPSTQTPVFDTVSETLSDFMFYLDDCIYQLPAPYQAFADHGWTFDYGDELELEGSQSLNLTLSKGEIQIDVTIVNLSIYTKKVIDCYIGEITIEAADNVDFYLGNKLDYYATQKEIVEEFGQPSSAFQLFDGSAIVEYYFEQGKTTLFSQEQSVTFETCPDAPIKNKITICNLIPFEQE